MPLEEWSDDHNTKRRSLPFSGQNASLVVYDYSPAWRVGDTQTYKSGWSPTALQGSEVTCSENHGVTWRSRSKRGFGGDIGGEFFNQKRYVKANPPSQAMKIAGIRRSNGDIRSVSYNGPILPASFATGNMFPPFVEASKEELNEMGAEAVARCKPTNSVADLSTFIGEIFKEGIPKMIGSQTWRERSLNTRNAGSEYLNFEFGWKPLVGEVRSVADAISRADTVIKQYRRDSGKMVRRRYEFPTETTTESSIVFTSTSVFLPVSTGDLYDPLSTNQGRVRRVRTTTRRKWFSGAFTYHLPDSNVASLMNAGAEAKKLLGLSLDPETLWNLTPWSWAVDWFSNAGDVISNLSDYATDGLVMRYGYLMEHSIVEDTYIWEGPTGLVLGNLPSSLTLVSETKLRVRANPFGFGFTWDGLSDRQGAILAALGMSRK